jgi:hypothetical protein
MKSLINMNQLQNFIGIQIAGHITLWGFVLFWMLAGSFIVLDWIIWDGIWFRIYEVAVILVCLFAFFDTLDK